MGMDRGAGDGGILTEIPAHRQRFSRLFRPPPAVRHHRDGVRQLHHAVDAFDAGELALVDRFQRALEHRTLHNRRVQHVRQPHVDGVDRLARNLIGNVEAPLARADQLPVFRLLERDLCGGRDVGGGGRDAAEGDAAAAGAVGNHALRGGAFAVRHIPARGGCGNEHGAGRRAGAAQIALRGADGAARARRHVAPDPVALAILVRRRELGSHLAPVAFELFRHQHRQGGKAALSHL